MLDRSELKIIQISENDINGGSFAITAALKTAPYPEATIAIQKFLNRENLMGLQTGRGYEAFTKNIFQHREDLLQIMHDIKSTGRVMIGYGAST